MSGPTRARVAGSTASKRVQMPGRYQATLAEVVEEITERLQADARARFLGRVGAGQVRQVWRGAVQRLEAALWADCEGGV